MTLESYVLHPVMDDDVLDSPIAPQKISSTNPIGLFRPFDTSPRNILKLSTDANNNSVLSGNREIGSITTRLLWDSQAGTLFGNNSVTSYNSHRPTYYIGQSLAVSSYAGMLIKTNQNILFTKASVILLFLFK